MNKVCIWSVSASAAVAFGGISRRGMNDNCGISQVECPDGSCAWALASCSSSWSGYSTGAPASSTWYNTYYTGGSSCESDWTTCSYDVSTQYAGVHTTDYSSYADYQASPYAEYDQYYVANDYTKYVASDRCQENWSECVGAANDYANWGDYASTMNKYGDWQSYAESQDYGKYTGDWQSYAGAEYAQYGDGGWTDYVKDYPQGADWGDYVSAANDKAYGDWRNKAKAAAKYDSYDQYYVAGVYAPEKYAEYGNGGWTDYVKNYPTNGYTADWGDYVSAANDKAYGDWRNKAKAAAKYDSYDQYYVAGVYTPEKYAQYGEGGWTNYVNDYPTNGYTTNWQDYVSAANDKAYGDWRNKAKAAAKYASYSDYVKSL